MGSGRTDSRPGSTKVPGSSMAERRLLEPDVGGSTPPLGTMPLIRCVSCNKRLDAKDSFKGRHRACWLTLKRERSQHMRDLGPCPQNAPCHHCKGYARQGDPMVFDHFPKRFVDGGRDVVPSHASCNQRRKSNRRSKG